MLKSTVLRASSFNGTKLLRVPVKDLGLQPGSQAAIVFLKERIFVVRPDDVAGTPPQYAAFSTHDISPCDDDNGRTWDVIRRADSVCVAQGIRTRAEAQDIAHAEQTIGTMIMRPVMNSAATGRQQNPYVYVSLRAYQGATTAHLLKAPGDGPIVLFPYGLPDMPEGAKPLEDMLPAIGTSDVGTWEPGEKLVLGGPTNVAPSQEPVLTWGGLEDLAREKERREEAFNKAHQEHVRDLGIDLAIRTREAVQEALVHVPAQETPVAEPKKKPNVFRAMLATISQIFGGGK